MQSALQVLKSPEKTFPFAKLMCTLMETALRIKIQERFLLKY